MRYVRFFGKLMISVGFGVLLFVVWTLKGTDLYTNRQQSRLEKEFARLPEVVAAPPADGPDENRRQVQPRPPKGFSPDHGDPIFRMTIPRIDLSKVVVEGVDTAALRMGPGHYPECGDGFTPPLCLPESYFPGEKGTVIVSGHRTTYGSPFWDLDKLRDGDEIRIEAKWGTFTYEVTQTKIVPANTLVHAPVGEERILLTTCHPRFSASERLIVEGEIAESEPI